MAGISSGAIEASKALSIERNKILSVHAMSNSNNTGSDTLVVKIWDSRPETNGEYAVGGTQSKTKEILRIAFNRNYSHADVGAFGNGTVFVNYA